MPFTKGNAQTANDSLNDSLEKKYEEALRYLEGIQAPDLEAEDINGKIVRLSDFSGKTIAIDFWFTTCGPCLSGMPKYNATAVFFKDTANVVVLSVCIEKAKAKQQWKKLSKQKVPGAINLFLDEDKTKDKNRFYLDTINGFPSYLLISPTGKILGSMDGPHSLIRFTYQIFRATAEVTVFNSYKEYLNRKDGDWLNQRFHFFSLYDDNLRKAIQKNNLKKVP